VQKRNSTKRCKRSTAKAASKRKVGDLHRRLRKPLKELGVTLIQGDSREKMAKMEENSVDAIICDPPYGLTDAKPGDVRKLLEHWLSGKDHHPARPGYGGKKWDSCVPSPQLWKEALRVLKPGGHLLAFGGSRTYHLTTLSLELAEFEIRDCIQWLYAQGKPASTNVGEALGLNKTARGSALKPSYEPIVVARKPLSEKTLEKNVAKSGTGALNIDACRIGGPDGRWPTNVGFEHALGCRRVGTKSITKAGQDRTVPRPGDETMDVYECVAGCPLAELEGQRKNSSRFFTVLSGEEDELDIPSFHFSSKASKSEREAGLAEAGFAPVLGKARTPGRDGKRQVARLNPHPTVKPAVKPQSIMRYLIRLFCPEGGVVLDPFNGSGSTGIAAALEGRRYIGIELDSTEGYLDVAAARIHHWATKNSQAVQQPSQATAPPAAASTSCPVSPSRGSARRLGRGRRSAPACLCGRREELRVSLPGVIAAPARPRPDRSRAPPLSRLRLPTGRGPCRWC
jgi:site-specific DNA-methyltransferase (adenine-specific)